MCMLFCQMLCERLLTGCSEVCQTLSTPSAILDIHFIPKNMADSIFGVSTSTGSIGIYQLAESDGKHPVMSHLQTIQYFPENELITAFSWHPEQSAVGMTLSTGEVCIGNVDLESPSHRNVIRHELEAWTLAFRPGGTGIYSGGDDSALHFVELPSDVMSAQEGSAEAGSTSSTLHWVDKKIHGAGVTAILPFHEDANANWVITGSYDDHIRLVVAPPLGRRQVFTEMNLGGGVWRLKMLGRKLELSSEKAASASTAAPEETLLLVSCMHAGTRIVKLSFDAEGGVWKFEVVAKFEEHKSMNYGSDSQPELNSKGQRTFISTSFYDRLLCLWRY
jgi:diphthamide biosynthesis protein 7